MLLQVARQLLKRVEEIRRGNSQLAEIDGYLTQKSPPQSRFVDAETDACCLIEDFEHVTRKQIFYAANLYKQLVASHSEAEARNRCSIGLCRATRLHAKTYLTKNYYAYVRRYEGGNETIRGILLDVGKFYALDQISHAQHVFLKGNFYTDAQAEAVRTSICTLLARLRPNAVGIVDALDFSDRELHSVLGKRDGNVYSALLNWAQHSQLNKDDVLPAYHKHISPMLRDGRSKL